MIKEKENCIVPLTEVKLDMIVGFHLCPGKFASDRKFSVRGLNSKEEENSSTYDYNLIKFLFTPSLWDFTYIFQEKAKKLQTE